MPLASGTKLGPYEVVAPLGAGGMGEVYRARDTRLERTVAIKILPTELSADAVRKQRFEREAKIISGLNHPNICTLHDVGSQDGVDYLVMEYVEGESLAQRLTKGPLPLDQVLKVGRELADALDKAHRSGIIHRDLKPGNIMLTKSGAKLLDFGLARPASPAASIATLTATATQPAPITQEGTIVGTFQYMSPEQVEGKELDARSDIFSLGAVLYEMVTGQRAFEGKSQLSVASAILEKEPAPISSLKPMSPRSLDHVIRRCLAKDPDDRWQTARDVALELQSILRIDSVIQTGAAVQSRQGDYWKWIALGLITVLLLSTSYILFRPQVGAELQQQTLRTSILPPENQRMERSNIGVLSPDGRFIVYPAYAADWSNQLWLRPLSSLTARPLPGTDGGYGAFWSPDSRWIAFFSGEKMKKISLDGGAPQVICNSPSARGGSWGPDGTILFVPGFGIPVYSVPATGGTPTPVTQLDKSLRELYHRWPVFLPDGKHFLFFSRGQESAIYLGTFGSTDRKLILKNDTNATYVSPGYLLFVKNGNLMAQPFDTKRLELTGTAIAIAENAPIDIMPRRGLFSASNNGIVSIQPSAGKLVQHVWVDRSGKVLEVLGEPAMYGGPMKISPDGQRAAFETVDPQNGSWNVWILDLKGHQMTRLTAEPSNGVFPVWSPDGREILYASNRLGPNGIFSIPASGVDEPRLFLPSDGSADTPMDWSPDGRYVAFIRVALDTPDKRGLWIAPTFGDKKPYKLVGPVGDIGGATFSRDGRWLAYHSNETGRNEVYVVPFPEANRKFPISSGGGAHPDWSSDGKQLYYVSGDTTLRVATITAGKDGLHVSNTEPLFKINDVDYGVSFDGKRFLIFRDAEGQLTSSITLISNWTQSLPR